MRQKDQILAQPLKEKLSLFEQQKYLLSGIEACENREAFLRQLIESIRRVNYISTIRTRDLSLLRANPSSDLFDPLKAAVLHKNQGQIDEAFWLVFLSVHFGKHRRTKWQLVRDIYGQLGSTNTWDWDTTNSSPERFCQWLKNNYEVLRGGDGVARHFGNHRKYESLNPTSHRWTGKVIESYIKWINPPRTHQMVIKEAQEKMDNNPRKTFDFLYKSMDMVLSFGRTARFDYLTMLGKLGLTSIEPGSTYMQGATGPLKGARLLFGDNVTRKLKPFELDLWLVELEAYLNVGMQVLEDALCNWQKSPKRFKRFRG